MCIRDSFDDVPATRKTLKEQWSESRQWPEILAMSYQMFAREYKALMEAGYCVLICDEAQALKESTSNIFAQVQDFIEQPGGAVFISMTGTPIHNEICLLYTSSARDGRTNCARPLACAASCARSARR